MVRQEIVVIPVKAGIQLIQGDSCLRRNDLMKDIKDISISELPLVVAELGLKKFATNQLIQWLYQKGATSFEEMTNLSKDARKTLSEHFYIGELKLFQKQESKDGTQKFAWKLSDGKIIESVMIPSEPYSKVPMKNSNPPVPPFSKGGAGGIKQRLTLCISTQVGCAMGCAFCRTGDMGYVRNLTQGEIVEQILAAQRITTPSLTLPPRGGGKGRGAENIRISNVVLMGMGEPFMNYENVLKAIRIMIDTKCLGLSRRHVTLSTCGLVPEIEKFAKEDVGVKLAISLNATTDEQREKIMPINKKYPLAKLFASLKKYSNSTKRSRVTFEYVMIGDFNDSHEDAVRLVKLISHVPAKVNLIPLNSGDDSQLSHQSSFLPVGSVPLQANLCKLQVPSNESTQRFAQYLRNKHIQVNIRASRGQDILAACGQLASKV